MTNQLNAFGFKDYEFISNYGKDVLTDNDKKMFRNINDAEISVCLHHIQCFKNIVIGNYDYALILEDDVVLGPDFHNKLKMYINELPENWDMLFVGDGCGYHIPQDRITNDKHIYLKDYAPSATTGQGCTRCLDSYIVSKKCASVIVNRLTTLKNYTILVPADLWLNNVIKNNRFKIYWGEPTICTQGSQKGVYKSSIKDR